jgi:aminoglycoside/choline kinase family phosphotransferase
MQRKAETFCLSRDLTIKSHKSRDEATEHLSRTLQLEQWLSQRFGREAFTFAPASEDASFRRYFRVVSSTGETCIAMDAPPEQEDCRPFVKVARLFAAAGVHVPQVLAEDLQQGFLLLSDLGSRMYLHELARDSAARLYDDATRALVAIQRASREGELPPYGRELLLRELRLFPDWYVARQIGATLTPAQSDALSDMFDRILANNLAQPRVYVHRDYHSRNLMVSEPNPGILDFQDAVYGPITYDLVSLFKDAYVSWDEELVLDWAIRYWERARQAGLPVDTDFALFYRDFEWMGVQRHVKVLGIFARLYHRDGKSGYLKDQPLVMRYLRRACERYVDLHPLLKLLDQLDERQAQPGSAP